MSDAANDLAVKAIGDVAGSLGVKVDPVLVAQLAGFVVGVLSGDKWGDAEKAGLARAQKVTDVTSAEQAAAERNR